MIVDAPVVFSYMSFLDRVRFAFRVVLGRPTYIRVELILPEPFPMEPPSVERN